MRTALVCSYYAPRVDQDTGSRRVMDLVETLVGDGWRVMFAAVHPDGSRYERDLEARGVTLHDASAGLGPLLASTHFELAVLAYWPVAERFLQTIRLQSPSTRILIDSIDVHLLRYARQLLGSGRRTLDEAFASEMIGEINTYAAADGVLTVSDREARFVSDLTGDAELAWPIPLAAPPGPPPAPREGRRGCVFVGSFHHAPNVDAVEFLCRDVFPRLDPHVRAAHPLYIVGSGMTESVRRLGDAVPDVRMVGWVPDLVPYLQRSRAALVPLRQGAGVKGKLLEAMAAGTPAVSTTVGVEGLEVTPEVDVVVADSATAFADALQRLLTDDALWSRLAEGGRRFVEEFHGPDAVRRRIRHAVSAVTARPAKSVRARPGESIAAARYHERLKFQDRHRTPRPMREVVRSMPVPRSTESESPGVLVIGVCLTDRPNTAAHVVSSMGGARWCRVEQRWATLGGAAPDLQVTAVVALRVAEPTPKFALVNRLLDGVDLAAFEFVVIADDDIHLPDGFLDAFIGVQRALGFALAQPARSRTSSIDHPIVEQQLGVTARRTRFVEIGPVVSVHRSAYAAVFPCDLTSPMGWGYENVWALELEQRGLRMGIVDTVPVEHRMRPTAANYDWSSADAARTALLRSRPHLPLDECMRVLEVFPAGA